MLKRLALLAACLGSGSFIGWAGRQATGHDAWFLAAPLLLTLAWLKLSDPSRCEADAARRALAARAAMPASDPGPPREALPPQP